MLPSGSPHFERIRPKFLALVPHFWLRFFTEKFSQPLPSSRTQSHMKSSTQFVADENTPPVIVAALKQWLPELSWSKVRKLLRSRRIMVGHTLCIDESRKLSAGEVVTVYEESLPEPPKSDAVKVHFVDRDIVVVDKPARMVTLRHKKERSWVRSKKLRQPTLEEVIPDLIYSPDRDHRPPVLSVHRIDRDTSGLLVWARHDRSQQALIEQFANHDVVRRYKAIVLGRPEHQTVRCRLVRNRGDGLRGSTTHKHEGKESVTHIEPLRTLRSNDGTEYTEIQCQLETGRTHQIRIHLAELGHPVCGDAVYRNKFGEEPIADLSQAPRLALHAIELGFLHPKSSEAMHFESDWPKEMKRFQQRLVGES